MLRGNGVVPAHVSFIGQMSDMRTQHNQRSGSQQQHNKSTTAAAQQIRGLASSQQHNSSSTTDQRLASSQQQQHNSNSTTDQTSRLHSRDMKYYPFLWEPRAERDTRHTASLPSQESRQPPAPPTRGCPGSCYVDKTGCLFRSLIYYLQHLDLDSLTNWSGKEHISYTSRMFAIYERWHI